jgi:hypothetical protein
MKKILAAASLLLVAGTAAACGGGAPSDASTDEFCKTQQSILEDMPTPKAGAEPDSKEVVKALKLWAERVEETGTPEDISDEARKGFEFQVKLIRDLDDDADKEDLVKIDKEMSDEEQAQSDAFDKYVQDTCGSPDPTAPSPSS